MRVKNFAGFRLSMRAKFKSNNLAEIVIMRDDTNEILVFQLPIKWSKPESETVSKEDTDVTLQEEDVTDANSTEDDEEEESSEVEEND